MTTKRGGMRKKTRRELRKHREINRFLLIGNRCCFCGESFVDETVEIKFGNADGPVLVERICLHHLDGNHDNNAHDNLALAHEKCHKAHHAREQRAKEKKMNVTTEDLKKLAETFDRLRAKKTAEHKCKVCNKDIGWDAPSGVCSERCLRIGQGFDEA